MSEINSSISMVSHIHSITADFVTERLSQKGMTDFASSHGNILFQLSRVPDMTLSELTQKINRDKSTTTVLVRKLENEGLIILTDNPDDKRSRKISLTEKGRQYNKQTSELSKELLETFYKGFTEEEKEQFVNYLKRIEENFAKIRK